MKTNGQDPDALTVIDALTGANRGHLDPDVRLTRALLEMNESGDVNRTLVELARDALQD
jgi:hypothetical protein